MTKPTIFIGYSHKDEEWKNLVVTHLGALKDYLDVWSDDQIASGDDWLQRIQQALERADFAILLISADFLTSKFIN